MKKNNKQLPRFQSEEDAFAFWESHDVSEYLDASDALVNPEFSNLKKTEDSEVKMIAIPHALLVRVKRQAEKRKMSPYTLIVRYIKNGLESSQI